MAIIRRKHFPASGKIDPDDIALIDTPEKVMAFAEKKGFLDVSLNVAGVAEEFGIRVEYMPMEDDLSGRLYKDEEDKSWVLSVNENHHPNRQRYTIAHELGHFCLHRHLKQEFRDRIFFRGGKASRMEWEANDFAGAILMPERQLRKMVRAGATKIDELAKAFGVSSVALRIRAKLLGMSGHGL